MENTTPKKSDKRIISFYILQRIQTNDVVSIAHIVPTGIDLEASAKSPDLLDPAIIPKIIKHT